MRHLAASLIAVASALPHLAAAQSAGTEAPPVATSPQPPSPATATDGATPNVATPATSTMLPMAERSYNLPPGVVELRTHVPIAVVPDLDTLVLVGLGGGYGLSEKLEVGGNFAFVAHPSNDIAPLFAAYARMQLVHTETASASLGTQLTFSPDLEGVLLSIGISARYRLTRQLSLFTESGFCGSCSEFLGPVTGQTIIALGSDSAVFGVLPVGAGLQATPDAYLYASLPLVAFNLTEGDAILIVRDAVLLSAGGWLTLRPKIDVGLQLTGDVKQLSDALVIGLSARFRI